MRGLEFGDKRSDVRFDSEGNVFWTHEEDFAFLGSYGRLTLVYQAGFEYFSVQKEYRRVKVAGRQEADGEKIKAVNYLTDMTGAPIMIISQGLIGEEMGRTQMRTIMSKLDGMAELVNKR